MGIATVVLLCLSCPGSSTTSIGVAKVYWGGGGSPLRLAKYTSGGGGGGGCEVPIAFGQIYERGRGSPLRLAEYTSGGGKGGGGGGAPCCLISRSKIQLQLYNYFLFLINKQKSINPAYYPVRNAMLFIVHI